MSDQPNSAEFELKANEVETAEQLEIIALLSKLVPVGEVIIDSDNLAVEIIERQDAPWKAEDIENALFDKDWMVVSSTTEDREDGQRVTWVEAERIETEDEEPSEKENEGAIELLDDPNSESATENNESPVVQVPKGWWDGPTFRAGPEVTHNTVLNKLPPSGKIDVIGISGELGCTAAHVRNMLRHLGVVERDDHTFWMENPTHVVESPVKSIDAETENAVDALEAFVKNMTPEAKEHAIKTGLLAKPKYSYAPRTKAAPKLDADGNPIPKAPRPAKQVEMHECACGCGELTANAFRMGHDARAKGLLQRLQNGKLAQHELGWQPNANLIAYVVSHPEWLAKFEILINTLTTPVSTIAIEDRNDEILDKERDADFVFDINTDTRTDEEVSAGE